MPENNRYKSKILRGIKMLLASFLTEKGCFVKVQLTENTYFGYSREIEYVAALAGILGDNLDGRACREVFGEEFVTKFRKRHRELAEVINTMFLGGLEILECLMDYDMEKAGITQLDMKKYRTYMESLPKEKFVRQFFGYGMSEEEVMEACKNEEFLAACMDDKKIFMSSFVNLKRIVHRREEFFDLYFAALEDVKTPELEAHLDNYEKLLPRMQNELLEKTELMDSVALCEDLMGKEFSEKHSFSLHAFIPVCMLPRNTVTYYEKHQYTLYSEKRMVSRQKALGVLKVVSDETRLRIIDILSEMGKANGKYLVKKLHVSPSTVSHHMDLLIDCGIAKEEKNGNSKEYSISYHDAENFIHELEGIILKNKDYV